MISEAAVSPPINNKQTDQVFTPRKSARLNNPVTNNPKVISKTAASPRMKKKKAVGKKSTRVSSSMKLPEKENPTEVSDATLNTNSAGVKSKLDFNTPHDEEENTDENEFLVRKLQPDLLIYDLYILLIFTIMSCLITFRMMIYHLRHLHRLQSTKWRETKMSHKRIKFLKNLVCLN